MWGFGESQNKNLNSAVASALQRSGVKLSDDIIRQFGIGSDDYNRQNNQGGMWGGYRTDPTPASPYTAMTQPTRFFSTATEKGWFDTIDDAAKAITFDDNGNLMYTGPGGSGMGIMGGGGVLMPQFAGNQNFDMAIADLTAQMNARNVWGYGDRNNKDVLQKAIDAINTVRKPYDFFNVLNSGKQYDSFYNDDTIKEAFPNENRPLTWAEYYAKSVEGINAQYSDGTSINGPAVLGLLRKEQGIGGLSQGLGLLQQIEQNYDQYRADYMQGGTNFLGQKNQAKAAEQAATDTDPTKRQVADYGVQGDFAPTGQSGWGRGNVQSSEGFQDTRRRGWGQTTIQGV